MASVRARRTSRKIAPSVAVPCATRPSLITTATKYLRFVCVTSSAITSDTTWEDVPAASSRDGPTTGATSV